MARDTHQRGKKGGHRPGRRITVRGERRDEPDLRKLAQALIALAQAQAEADAEAAHAKQQQAGLGRQKGDHKQGSDAEGDKEVA